MRYRLPTLAALIGCLVIPSAGADTMTECHDAKLRVLATDGLVAGRVCDVVERAKPMLAACGLGQDRPLEIHVRDDPGTTGLIGHYSPSRSRISLQSPARLAETLSAESVFRNLPPMQFFESVVVHELVHAFFVGTRCGQETCLAGHEYIAYAMQLQSLDPGARSRLLDALPQPAPTDLAWFSDDRLTRDPEAFAVNAWRHFAQQKDGCGLVNAIAAGTVAFPSDLE